MKVKKRDTVEMVVIFTIMISIIIFLSGCTYTIYQPPVDMYQASPYYAPVAQLDRASAF